MSINRKNADGTYTEVAGVPYVTKENIGLSKVENKSPEELVAMSMEANGYVTPQIFGAKGDGITDDTEAFKAAIQAALNGYIVSNHWDVNKDGHTINLFIPSGEYIISDTLEIPSYLNIFGEGKTSSKLISNINDGKAVIKLGNHNDSDDSYEFVSNIQMKDFSINGDNKNCIGLYLCTERVTISNIGIYKCNSYGVYGTDAIITRMDMCDVHYCGGTDKPAIYIGGKNKGGFGCHNFVLSKCNIDSSTVYSTGYCAIKGVRSSSLHIHNCCIEGWINGVILDSTCTARIDNNYFEDVKAVLQGDLYNTIFTNNFVTSATDTIKADVLKGCVIAGNNILTSDYGSFLKPISSIVACEYNVVYGNFRSGFLTNISDEYKEAFKRKGNGNTFISQGGSLYSGVNFSEERGERDFISMPLKNFIEAGLLNSNYKEFVTTGNKTSVTDSPIAGWASFEFAKISDSIWNVKASSFSGDAVYSGVYNDGTLNFSSVIGERDFISTSLKTFIEVTLSKTNYKTFVTTGNKSNVTDSPIVGWASFEFSRISDTIWNITATSFAGDVTYMGNYNNGTITLKQVTN